MTFAEHISGALCAAISAEPCFASGRIWGLAEQVEKDGRMFPVSSVRGEGNDILPDSRYPVQIYFRVLSAEREADEEGFGAEEWNHRLTIRIVAVGDIRTLAGCFNGQHTMADLLERAINQPFTFPNWYNVNSGRVRKVTDKREVLNAEFRGVPWESRILDLLAVSLDIDFDGVECPVVCAPPPQPDCDPEQVVVSWHSEGDGAIIYNTENNCAYFFREVPEWANQNITMCAVSYVSGNMVVGNNPNNCPVVLTAEIIGAESDIQGGSYPPTTPECELCEPIGIRTTLISSSSPLGPAFSNGSHTGAITQCQNFVHNFGPNPGVWFRLWWDCETCGFYETIGPGAGPGFLTGDLDITITYKNCEPQPPPPCDLLETEVELNFHDGDDLKHAIYDVPGGCWLAEIGPAAFVNVISTPAYPLLNTPVRICGIAYEVIKDFKVEGGALPCPHFAQFFLVNNLTDIDPGGPGCDPCNEIGNAIPITTNLPINDAAWDVGMHTGSITSCEPSLVNFGTNAEVWCKINFDCSGGCEPIDNKIKAHFKFTIQYKLC